MGDLEGYMDEPWITELFKGLGYSVVSIRMIRNKLTGGNSAYCFIEFENESSAQKALVNLNLKPIPNTTRVFKLNWASTNHNNKTEHSVYVGELSEDVDDHKLFRFFAKTLVSCRSAKVVLDTIGKSKGFGFVRFNVEDDAKQAIRDFNLSPGLGTKRIRVCKAFPKVGGERRDVPGSEPSQYQRYRDNALAWQEYENQVTNYNKSVEKYQEAYNEATETVPYEDERTVEEMNSEFVEFEDLIWDGQKGSKWGVIDNIHMTTPGEIF